jgi:hypothetical protein
MNNLIKSPFLVLSLSFVILWVSARIGAAFRKQQLLEDDLRHDLDLVVGATLTLLGLIIGFTFSMAMGRYEERKNYEEGEASAIGTEYLRADLLPGTAAARVRSLLLSYLDQRILFYQTRGSQQLRQINTTTAQLQSELWSAVQAPAAAQPTAVVALVVAGMNDVLNAQGYTQAAWWNRIPPAAWGLMGVIAVCCNLLVGYGARRFESERFLMLIIPVVVSISFFLIADIDSPRGGVILVQPRNLVSLAQSLQAH